LAAIVKAVARRDPPQPDARRVVHTRQVRTGRFCRSARYAGLGIEQGIQGW
jgi:hypothetical protein